jgi:hypothetical protein
MDNLVSKIVDPATTSTAASTTTANEPNYQESRLVETEEEAELQTLKRKYGTTTPKTELVLYKEMERQNKQARMEAEEKATAFAKDVNMPTDNIKDMPLDALNILSAAKGNFEEHVVKQKRAEQNNKTLETKNSALERELKDARAKLAQYQTTGTEHASGRWTTPAAAAAAASSTAAGTPKGAVRVEVDPESTADVGSANSLAVNAGGGGAAVGQRRGVNFAPEIPSIFRKDGQLVNPDIAPIDFPKIFNKLGSFDRNPQKAE